MPARDKYHNAVRNALIKDGWTITHDPLRLVWGKRDMYVDLGAKKLLGAQKGERLIAVEIKSFAGASEMADLEKAVGQFSVYRFQSTAWSWMKLSLGVPSTSSRAATGNGEFVSR